MEVESTCEIGREIYIVCNLKIVGAMMSLIKR